MNSSQILSLTLTLALLGVIFSLLFPAVSVGPRDSAKAQAKNDVTQISTAVTAYGMEYGHMPPSPTNGIVGGELLSALVGRNQALNPRKIVFIEVDAAKKGKKSGMSNGNFVDPWGAAYQIAVATGTNATVTAGTNHVTVNRKVAVWNDPNQHTDAAWFSPPKKSRRYVTSWE